MKDRIRFSNGNASVNMDKKSFEEYAQGKIPLDTLCRRLEISNDLPVVTAEQALKEYEMTGWKYIAEKGKWK